MNSPYELIDLKGTIFSYKKQKQDLRPTHTQQLLFDVFCSFHYKGGQRIFISDLGLFLQ